MYRRDALVALGGSPSGFASPKIRSTGRTPER
jgi:hypothetical protein